MLLKNYSVYLKPADQAVYDQFWHELENPTNQIPNVPDRIVEISNEMKFLTQHCDYYLTAEEATTLASDPRVQSINCRDDMKIFNMAIMGGVTHPKGTYTGAIGNWGLIRSNAATNVYGTGNTASTPDYTYTLDGTGVDIIVADSGLQVDHPEFFDVNGASRVQQINWFTASGVSGTQSANHYRDFDGHGTHCAGLAAGKTFGFAKNARIYSIKIAGLEGSGDSGNGISISDFYNVVIGFHNNKAVDARGVKRPTILTMSWGYIHDFGGMTGGRYRGTTYTATTADSSKGNLGSRIGMSYDSEDASLAAVAAAGVHIFKSAGNYYHKIDVSGGLDYDNYYTTSGVNYYYNRAGSPTCPAAIVVGATDTTPYSASLDQKAVFSESGPDVEIYAPGYLVNSSTSTTNRFGGGNYYLNSSFKQVCISGTSMATPLTAGLGALFVQLSPTASPASIKAAMLDKATATIYTTGLDNDYTDHRSIKGSAQKHLFNPFNSASNTLIAGTCPTYSGPFTITQG
jgi:subtilisin family serine protease